MSTPFTGEIRAFGFQFAPRDWAFCNGQPLSIEQFAALFALIGTTYGGDGQTTFNLPNLQGNVPMHWGTGPGGFNTVIGQVQGSTTVTLTTAQTPQHNHTITVQEFPSGGDHNLRTPKPNPNAWLSNSAPYGLWWDTGSPNLNAQFSQSALSPFGGSQPHENMQPYLAVNFCICLNGIFPSRN
jgi:microcystin-dependent protein